MRIERGFTEAQRPHIARLFWQAFSGKLMTVLGPDERALAFLERVMHPDFAICAVDEEGGLLGAAGFKTLDGGLVGGEFADIAAIYGPLGALWRGPLLGLTDRPLQPGVLLMDGIFVDARARGRGVGHRLIQSVVAEAERRGCDAVRLDVVDNNPRARSLYTREGFVETRTNRVGPLHWIYGFREVTTMVRPVRPSVEGP